MIIFLKILAKALKDKHYVVLGIHSTQGITTALFRSIRRLATQDPDTKLIVYVRDTDPDEEFISLARNVYFYNAERSEKKKLINKELGSLIVEEKDYSTGWK